jgi:ABC-type phosphate/phosphonate transport system substrate-binding protein
MGKIRLNGVFMLTIWLFPIAGYSDAADDAPFEEYVKHLLSKRNDQPSLIFTAPPRNQRKDMETYTPIIEFLAKTLNRKIEYRVPSGWLGYNNAMIADTADIVFDGPHFNAWRMNHLGHRIIVRLPQQQVWKILVSRDSTYSSLEELSGKRVCLQGATNFGKLNFMSYFPNVMRLPEVVQIKSRQDGFNEVIRGTCAATIVTDKELDKYNDAYGKADSDQEPPVKVLHTLTPTPNQAFSVSSRLEEDMQLRIQKALMSKEGQQAMAILRDRYASNETLVEANEKNYKALSNVLSDSYPFYNPFGKSVEEAYGARSKQAHEN